MARGWTRFLRDLAYLSLLGLILASPACAAVVAPKSIYYYQTAQTLDVYKPDKSSSAEKGNLPAIVFFHGGAWVGGGPSQFIRQANWLIERANVVVISASYPTNANPIESTKAAQAALCWVGSNAGALGIDVTKIAVAGGSAGGQLALSTVILAGKSPFDECSEKVRIRVAALLLFNPVVNLRGKWERRFGMDLSAISPMQSLTYPLPPTLVLHGTADKIVPVESVRVFVRKSREQGSKQVELVEFVGRGHGFFNSDNKGDREAVLESCLTFIRQLGWLPEGIGKEANSGSRK